MKFAVSKYSVSAMMISAAILAGCGGGGGGSSATPTTAGTSAITITSTNAPDVAANAVNASDGLTQSGGASSLITGVTVNTSNTASHGLLNASLQQIYKAIENLPAANLPVGVTTTLPPTACQYGGTISATVTAANSITVSNGDSMSITANNCNTGTSILNGGFNTTFSHLSGQPGSYSAWSGTLAMTFNNMKITKGTEAEQFNGDMTVGITQRGHLDADASISGNSLQLILSHSGTTVLDRTLSAFAYSGTVNSNLETYSDNFTITGNLSNAGNGVLTVTTTTAFKQLSGAYPYQGAFKVTGAGNTSLTVTALDNTNVRLDIDKTGDGVTDETVNTTWAALAARI
jgi:hypothetical protein